ncbi:MAG: efflux RND transporter periplasmic adaptor subunit [Capsulimonas sp.]|uniref:efflux RND transporter periplasmic adaptor subunit n=1 Tax=Capsulimonas sp. TaxID=2494211 RepID=UPI003263BEB8
MKRIIPIVIVVVLIGALIVWRLNVNKADATKLQSDRGRGAAVVAASKATVRDIVKTFQTTANIESPQTVKLSPKVAGQIVMLALHEGDSVRRGQIVAKVDDTELQATVRKQVATVAQAQARLLQAQATQNTVGVGVGTQIQQQAAGVAAAQADYAQARQTYNAQVATADAAVADAQSKVGVADAQIANAQAGVRSAQANYDNANTQLTRTTSLLQQGAVAQQEADTARTTAAVQKGNVDVAIAQLNSAKASRASAQSLLESARHQAQIVRTTQKTTIASSLTKVTQAQAALRNAKANTTQPAAYRANLTALQADVASAQADLTNARAQLAQTSLISPIDGFVSARYADPGTLASPGSPVLALQALRQVWATIAVPQEQIRHIGVGQNAEVTVDSLPGRKLTGRVIQVNPSGDPASRDFTVRLAMNNGDGALKPGMFARVSLITESYPHVTTIPPEAVEKDQDGSFVWLITPDGKLQRTPVQTGASSAAAVEITKGIQPGDQVVTVSGGRLKDGQDVKINSPTEISNKKGGGKKRRA